MEEKNNDKEINKNDVEEKSGFFKKTITKLTKLAEDGKEKITDKYDEHKRKKETEKAIKNETCIFEFSNMIFLGFFDVRKPDVILVPEDQISVLRRLDDGCIITSKNDNVKYVYKGFNKIADIERQIVTEHGEETINCYYLSVEKFSPKLSPVNNYITNTVTQNISNSSIIGDVNFVSKISNDLNELENGINNIKVGKLDLIKKKNRDYVVEHFGVFKDNIINGNNDKGFFKNFIDALSKVAPALATLAFNIVNKNL